MSDHPKDPPAQDEGNGMTNREKVQKARTDETLWEVFRVGLIKGGLSDRICELLEANSVANLSDPEVEQVAEYMNIYKRALLGVKANRKKRRKIAAAREN